MAETKKRARKSRIEVRDFVDLEETQNYVLQSSDDEDILDHKQGAPGDNESQTPDILKRLLKHRSPVKRRGGQTLTDHDYALATKSPTSVAKRPNISIQVEVEELDEESLHPHNDRSKRKPEIETFRVDFNTMFSLSDLIREKSSNIADKYLSIEMKNIWGRSLTTKNKFDPHEQLIQGALNLWSQAAFNSKQERDSPLFYQCYICYSAWWHLEPFRNHIRKHKAEELRVYYIESNCDSFIAASSHVGTSSMYISCSGECYRCGNPYSYHIRPIQQEYFCKFCHMKFPNCTASFHHKYQCNVAILDRRRFTQQCIVCSASFQKKFELEAHLTKTHIVRTDIVAEFIIKKCQLCMESYHCFSMHQCKKYCHRCSYCYRVFSTSSQLNIHIEMGEKDSHCKICNLILDMSCMETQHMLTHTENFKMAHKCVNAACSPNVLFVNEKSARYHSFINHNKRNDHRKAFSEKIVVPRQCMEESNVDPTKFINYNPTTSNDWSIPGQAVRIAEDAYQVSENLIVKEELLEMEPLESPTQSDDDTPMDYAEMLSKVFNINTEDDTNKKAKKRSETKKQPSKLQNQHETPTTQPESQPKQIKTEPTKPRYQKPGPKSKKKSLIIPSDLTDPSTYIKIAPKPNEGPKISLVQSMANVDEGIFEIQPIEFENRPSTSHQSNEIGIPSLKPTQSKKYLLQPSTEMPEVQLTMPEGESTKPKVQPSMPESVAPQGTDFQAVIKTEPIDFDTIDIEDDPITIKHEPIEACLGSFSHFYENDTQNDNQSSPSQSDSQSDTQNDSQSDIDMMKIKDEPRDTYDVSQENIEFDNEINVNNILAVKMEPEEVQKELLNVEEVNSNDFSIKSNIETVPSDKVFKRYKRDRRQNITILSTADDGEVKEKKIVKNDKRILRIVEKNLSKDEPPIITIPNSDIEKKHRNRKIEFDSNGKRLKRMYTCHKCGYTQQHKLFALHKKSNCEFVPFDDVLSYICTKCDRKFDRLTRYLSHFILHGFKKYNCPCCDVSFNKALDLVPHFQNHIKSSFVCCFLIHKTLEEPDKKHYKCRTCDMIVESGTLFNHFEQHLTLKEKSAKSQESAERQDSAEIQGNKRPQSPGTLDKVLAAPASRVGGPVDISSTRYLQPDTLQIALDQLYGDPKSRQRDCKVCGHPFSRRNDIKRHVIEHLLADAYCKKDSVPTNMLRCQICQADFTKAELYKFHMRQHGALPVYRCELCDKTFSDSSNFAKHKKIHNMRVMVCDVCGKKFHAKSTLEKHMIMHMTTEPISCHLCKNRKFYERSQYKKHMRAAHSKTGLQFRCRQCEELVFHSLREKWEHQWAAHGDRLVKADCPVCRVKFRKFQEVKRHAKDEHDVDVRIHTFDPASDKQPVVRIKKKKNKELKKAGR